MFRFQVNGYVIISVMCLIAIAILFYLLRQIRNKSLKTEIKNFKMRGVIEIVLGGIFILLSAFWFLAIQKDTDNTIPILQPVAIMTSEPIKLLAIGLFLTGVIILITGSYSLYQYKRSSL